MYSLRPTLTKLLKNKNIKFGVPFIVFMVGASFGLKKFASLRYEYTKVTAVTKEELKELEEIRKATGEVTLESEYEKMKELDIDNWVNIRGPRPWEEPQKETPK